jgi:3-deoxy-D-manno-octulosonate 8-phosphate phosphatase (KDO 8-P phosphatase)
MKNFIIDVDGVLTDGQFHYTTEGKVAKIFGPDDADGLLLIKPFINVIAVTGDKRGFPITQKRVEEDMKLPLFQVSTFERVAWIEERYPLEECIYMGDGIFDAMVFDKVGYAIAPANVFEKTKPYADYVTNSVGGSGAVAEACFHIMEKFFTPLDPLNLRIEGGVWVEKNNKS